MKEPTKEEFGYPGITGDKYEWDIEGYYTLYGLWEDVNLYGPDTHIPEPDPTTFNNKKDYYKAIGEWLYNITTPDTETINNLLKTYNT